MGDGRGEKIVSEPIHPINPDVFKRLLAERQGRGARVL
jgi:hypothetical protein